MIITIVGVGALGSNLVLLMRNIKQPLKLIDFDQVESKNVQAQFHTKMAVGRNKAQALQQSMQMLFGRRDIEAVTNKLTQDNVEALLKNSDLVIDCVDNIKSRVLIQDFVRSAKIPCLHGALSQDGTFGRIMWDELFVPDSEGTEGAATCEDGQALPVFMLVAAQLAVSVQAFFDRGERRSLQVTANSIVRLA